jgi:hypothetical protein
VSSASLYTNQTSGEPVRPEVGDFRAEFGQRLKRLMLLLEQSGATQNASRVRML